jgi:hypothetical protein
MDTIYDSMTPGRPTSSQGPAYKPIRGKSDLRGKMSTIYDSMTVTPPASVYSPIKSNRPGLGKKLENIYGAMYMPNAPPPNPYTPGIESSSRPRERMVGGPGSIRPRSNYDKDKPTGEDTGRGGLGIAKKTDALWSAMKNSDDNTYDFTVHEATKPGPAPGLHPGAMANGEDNKYDFQGAAHIYNGLPPGFSNESPFPGAYGQPHSMGYGYPGHGPMMGMHPIPLVFDPMNPMAYNNDQANVFAQFNRAHLMNRKVDPSEFERKRKYKALKAENQDLDGVPALVDFDYSSYKYDASYTRDAFVREKPADSMAPHNQCQRRQRPSSRRGKRPQGVGQQRRETRPQRKEREEGKERQERKEKEEQES